MATTALEPATDNLAQRVDLFSAQQQLSPASRAGLVRLTLAALAPGIAAALALLVHRLLPVRQILPMGWLDNLPPWQHPYPIFLMGIIGASICLSALQWAWRPLRSWALHFGPLLAGAMLLLIVWEYITAKTAWMPQPFFPGPDEVFGALVEDREMLLTSAWHSLSLLLTGYATGVTAGLITGVLIGWFPRVRYWVLPVLKTVGPIPATTLVALAMMLFTWAFAGGVALIGFAVWFPMSMLTSSGIANVRLSYLDVARTLGAGRMYLIFRVAIPSALPNIFLGLFVGLTASFLTLIVAETMGVKGGLGWYLLWQKGYAEYAKVYATLMIMAVFFSSIMTLLFKVRDRVLKWQQGVIKW